MKRFPYLWEITTGMVIAILVAFILSSCQPKTVIVEYEDEQLVIVEPTRAAELAEELNADRFKFDYMEEIGVPVQGRVDRFYRVYEVYDMKECTYAVLMMPRVSEYGTFTLSSRYMTLEEKIEHGCGN